MTDVTTHPYREAIEAFASDLAKLDSATAHAIAAEAREMVRAAWLRQEIQKGRDSGKPLDGEQMFDELLVEAEADIQASKA